MDSESKSGRKPELLHVWADYTGLLAHKKEVNALVWAGSVYVEVAGFCTPCGLSVLIPVWSKTVVVFRWCGVCRGCLYCWDRGSFYRTIETSKLHNLGGKRSQTLG